MLLGWVVERATIEGPEHCIDPLLVAVAEPALNRQRAFGRLVDLGTYMTVVFAGPSAEAATVGARGDDPVPGVIDAAKADLGSLLSDQELEHLIGGPGAHAERIVARSAEALAELSTALVAQRSLTAAEIERVVRPALPKYAERRGLDDRARTVAR